MVCAKQCETQHLVHIPRRRLLPPRHEVSTRHSLLRRQLYAVSNGVMVTRPGRSVFAYALDWIRHFDDLTRLRLALEVLRRPSACMENC